MSTVPEQLPLLTDLLKEVSRSFYLTLRILPKEVRAQIGLAYLLARTSDTIADTTVLPASARLHALEMLRQRIANQSTAPLLFPDLLEQQHDSAERALLLRVQESLALLENTPAPDQRLIQQVLEVIIGGQALDLKRFAEASDKHIIPLDSLFDLDDYTYRVAGCVGEFWTAMCLAHLFACTPEQSRSLQTNGLRFGKGLQLVNILRDLPADLRQGRCYVPQQELQSVGLQPSDLLRPEKEAQFRPVYNQLLDVAEAHLTAGWEYTNALPRKVLRVRLACAWPVLIGLQTLRLLRHSPVLDPKTRIKVPRSEVKWIIVQSILYYPFSSRWRQMANQGR